MNKMMKYSSLNRMLALVAIGMISLVGSAKAQNLTVGGRVTNEKGEGLPFVNVALMRPTDTVFMRGATTDLTGEFEIRAVAPGRYLLQASFVGYESWMDTIDVIDTIDNIDIALRMAGTTLKEVQITAEKPLYAMDGEKNMYNTKEDPSIQTGTASDALQNAPGVEVDAEGNITLRGVSSVEIWVNDRPSHMNEEALKQYIKTLPANAIERIEVITNPSARYSTTGGVINIVTNQKVVRNELLCLGVRARTTPSVSPWLSYVWANEKVDFNFYLNGDYTQHRTESNGTTLTLDANGDTLLTTDYNGRYRNHSYGGYAGFNVNWQIDSMTNLAAWAGVYPYWQNQNNITRMGQIEYTPTPVDYGYRDTTTANPFWGGGYVGAWFEHRYDTTGRKLSLTLNGNGWLSRSANSTHRYFTNPAFANMHRVSRDFETEPSLSVGVNYTLPLAHGFELEMGADVEGEFERGHDYLDTLNAATGLFERIGLRSEETRSDHLDLDGYLTAQKRWGNFTAKVGLRFGDCLSWVERSHADGSAPTRLDTSFLEFVPSLHLSYRTDDFHNFSLNYTRRHSHPTVTSLVDFRTYGDNDFSTGNPALAFSYTHNIEAAWSKFFMGFGSVGLNAYAHINTGEEGTMNGVTDSGAFDPYFGYRQVHYTYPVNIGSSHTEGLEANITYRPTAFLNVRLNASVFNYAYNYNDFNDSHLSWSARLNVWTKLWGWLEVFANAHYTSPRLSLYSMTVANKGVDFGVSSDFFDRKLSVYLNVNDIFGMAEWGSNVNAPQYQTTGSQRYDSQFVSFGLTWRIGKMELESKARQGASEGNAPTAL